jgi:DNA-binding MarR family transcriptional regulator
VPRRTRPNATRGSPRPDVQPTLARIEELKAQSLGHALLRSARLLDERAVAKVRAESGVVALSRAHTALLPHLDFTGTRQSLLAERMSMSKQAVNQIVDDLEAMGVVGRRPDPSDGRAKLVFFTQRGRQAILHGIGVLASFEAEAARHMGPSRVRLLHKLLTEFLEILERQ